MNLVSSFEGHRDFLNRCDLRLLFIILDQTGAAVPNASITIANTDIGIVPNGRGELESTEANDMERVLLLVLPIVSLVELDWDVIEFTCRLHSHP